jgi:hypothetical protein
VNTRAVVRIMAGRCFKTLDPGPGKRGATKYTRRLDPKLTALAPGHFRLEMAPMRSNMGKKPLW